MPAYSSAFEILRAIATFMMTDGASLPDHTREALLTAQTQGSSVDTMMQTMEALYAAKSDLPTAGKQLVADIAEFAIPYNFYQVNVDNRGGGIQLAMMRDIGMLPPEGRPWPDPSQDPAPLPQYLAAPPQPIIVMPPAAELEPAPVEDSPAPESTT